MRSIFTTLTISTLLVALAACGGSTYVPKKPEVQVLHRTHTVFFDAGMNLPAQERQDMEAFFADIPKSGSHVRILAGEGDRQEQLQARNLRGWLLGHGFDSASVEVVTVSQPPEQLVTLVEYVVALAPKNCPDWSDGETNYRNKAWANYGCADAANLARQVEDPNDLVRGHGSAALDGDRNAVAITKYKTDTVTQTNKESASSGSGSQ